MSWGTRTASLTVGNQPVPDLAANSHLSQEAVTAVKKTSNDIIDSIVPPSEAPKQKKYVCPDFVIRNDNGIFVDLNRLSGTESFFSFVQEVFSRGHYFSELQYGRLMTLLYDFGKVEETRQKIAETGKRPTTKIASGIKKFPPEQVPLYRKPRMSGNGKTAEYVFFPPRQSGKEKREFQQTDKADMDIDLFIAVMWASGIRFGLDIKEIVSIIGKWEYTKAVIARPKEPVSGIPSRMEPMISFEVNRWVKGGEGNGQVDIHTNERSHVEVRKDTILYKKVPQIDGVPGWTISGNQIPLPHLPDFPIQFYCGEGVRAEVRDGQEYLVSDRDGFPREEKEVHTPGKGKHSTQRFSRVHVDTEKTFFQINHSTGRVTAENDVTVEEDIVRDTRGRNVTAKKDVEANIHASKNIAVHGSVFGAIMSSMDASKRRKSNSLHKWRIHSDEGSILIRWSANHSHLEAKNGTVKVSDAANSTIVAKRVEISWRVFNSTIIAEEVVIKWEAIGCRILAGKSIRMQESAKRAGMENMLNLFSIDMRSSIEAKNQWVAMEKGRAQKIEDEIDQLLTSRLSFFARLDKERRVTITPILMNILLDQEILEQEKYKTFREMFQKMESALKLVNMEEWERLQASRLSIKKLSDAIVRETAATERFQKDLSVCIKSIHAPVHVRWIRFFQETELLDLSPEEIENIFALGGYEDVLMPCKFQAIPSPQSGSFEWKPVLQEG